MTLTLPCPQIIEHQSDASTEPPFTSADFRSAAGLRAAVTTSRSTAGTSLRSRPPRCLAVACQRLVVRVEAALTSRTTARGQTTCCLTPGS